jgi:hypothetical protein
LELDGGWPPPHDACYEPLVVSKIVIVRMQGHVFWTSWGGSQLRLVAVGAGGNKVQRSNY